MKILEQNNKFSIISEFKINDKLANFNYLLDWDSFGNLFLIKTEELFLPEKIYDFNKKSRKIIINSFNKLNKNTGVLLSGEKGTGKSIDAKLLCKEINIPIIIINKQIPLTIDFASFLNTIKQDFLLFIDEFEKLFNNFKNDDEKYHSQESFLTIIDGLNNNYKKLFLFTANDGVSDFLINRPSRIKFYIKYKGIKEEEANEIANDLLINREFSKDLIENINLCYMTKDILISIIEEINIQNMPYSEFKDIFNFNEENNEAEIWEKTEDLKTYTKSSRKIIDSLIRENIIYDNRGTTFIKLKEDNEFIYYQNNGREDHLLKIKLLNKQLKFIL